MKKLSTVLAFDLGASSGRALIGELVEENTIKLQITEIHRFPNEAIAVGGRLYWDILRLLQELKAAIRIAFQRGYAPQSFAIDTWGVDFGLLDRSGELLGNPYHYRDAHTEGIVDELNDLIGKESMYEQGGLQFMPFNTVNQLYAMAKSASPKLGAAQTLLLTPDLLAYFLTGQKVCEFTMATTTGLFHPVKQQWNKLLMDRLGIPSSIFLDPIHPGTIIGPLTEAVSEELEVPPINAIAVGSHDTESAVAAVPAAANSPFAYLVCGTWSLLGTELSQPIVTAEAMELEFSNEGGVGGTYQLLKNIMGLWIIQECKREWDESGLVISYSELAVEAQQSEPFRSLIYPDDACFYPPSGMIETIQAYCRESGQPIPLARGAIVRCVLDSLALRYREALEQMESLTGECYEGLHMVGGGIQNELLCQLTANAIGRPVSAGPVEASAIGNMLIQFIALGLCGNLQQARSLVSSSFPSKRYEPVPAEQAEWHAAYDRFCRMRG